MIDLKANIKKVNYGEEIAFEQTLMTDNLGRKDFIIIDRQVQGGGLPGRMDLLAVKKNPNGKYSLLVLEVKLGNNKELEGEVLGQLDKYVSAINKNFSDFKECYEKNYAQKKELGLLPKGPKLIEIDGEVEGKIVVGSYSKIGKEAITKLKELNDKYSIQQFSHIIK